MENKTEEVTKRTINIKNYNRIKIIVNNYLQYLPYIRDSERNKEIVRQYTQGKTYTELAEEYGVSTKRIAQIIINTVRHVHWYIKENVT